MASNEDLPQEFSGICSQIEELRALVLKDPSQAVKLLPSALDELKTRLEEHFNADKEIKQAERAARASEERLKALMDHTPSLVFMKDEEGRYVYLNKAYERKFALLEDWCGKTDFDFWPEKSAELFRQNDSHVLESGETHQFIEDSTDLNGTRHCWLCYKFPFIGSKNKKYLGGIGIDATDLVIAEEALKESKERYSTLFNCMAEGFALHEIICNEQGEPIDYRFLDVNPAFEQLTGLLQKDVIGRTFSEILPDENPRWIAVCGTVALTGEPAQFEKYSAVLGRYYQVFAYCPAPGQFAVVFIDITERKKAEEALQQSEEKYRTIVETANEGIIIVDLESSLTFANRAFARMLLYPPEELISKNILDFFDKEYLDLAVAKREEQRKHCCGNSYESKLVRRDGTPLWVMANSSPLLDKEGRLAGSLIMFTDITERKHMEESLRKSEQHYRLLFETMLQGLVYQDADGTIISMNPAAERILGQTQEEFLGRSSVGQESFTIKEDSSHFPGIEHPSMVALQTGQELHNVVMGVYNPRSDCYRWINIDAIPLFRPGEDKPYQVYTIFDDITERKQAENELRELNCRLEVRVAERTSELLKSTGKIQAERERFLRVIDTLPVIINIIRKDYHVEWQNRACIGALGNNEGRLCYEGQFGRDKPCEECQAFIPLITGQPHHWEWTLPDGRTFDIYNFPFVGADGSPAILEMDIDITERRKAEAEMIRARKELEEINEVLKAKNEELEAAKAVAESAVEAKTAFLANMSHELRTPMNAVIGFSSLLLDDNLTIDQRDYIERIRTGGETLLGLINDILDFSKAEKGKVSLYHSPISLRATIEESLEMVAFAAKEKGLSLAYSVRYGTPDTIIGDHGRLRQILTNLLDNAVKFTDKGEISVSVSSVATDKGRHRISVAVRDTGIGISPDKMDLLFKPFSRVDTTLSSVHSGSGLGLAISKSLIDLMGGKIWAESIPGQGSTFSFTIVAEVASDLPARISAEATDFSNLAKCHPLRILVAEDNPSNQKMLIEMLKKMSYMPDAAADGFEVLQAMERRPYDIIFMDVRMPRMDGLAATREIRRLWPNNGPKIIAITAYALSGDREKCLEAGMDDYIAKPVQKGELADKLKKLSLRTQ